MEGSENLFEYMRDPSVGDRHQRCSQEVQSPQDLGSLWYLDLDTVRLTISKHEANTPNS